MGRLRDSLTRTQVREFDRRAIEEYGVPSIVLMENAGRGAAELLVSLGIQGRVIVCCGKGNNGGDGFVIARHLDLQNVDVRVTLFASPEELTGDARTNYEILTRSLIPTIILDGRGFNAGILRKGLAKADWVVDALFGTGLSGPVRPPFDSVIEQINGSGKKVLAVDVPSGLDCNSGQPLGPTVRAQHTATFVALKRGFSQPESRQWTGEVHVLKIGAPRVLVREFLMPKEPVGESPETA
jgi:NAD(P)H-hydrate epimerase